MGVWGHVGIMEDSIRFRAWGSSLWVSGLGFRA